MMTDNLKHLLCPAGDGVFTVSTDTRDIKILQQQLYGDNIHQGWQRTISNYQQTDKPLILGIPSDCGGGILRGANWGPYYLRQQLYTKYDLTDIWDMGDIRVIPQLLHDKYLNVDTIRACQQALYDGKHDLAVSPLSMAELVADELFKHHSVFGIGGDHSCSYPLVKSFLTHHPDGVLIHFDAHTDLLDKRMGIDICFGTWVYHILPRLKSSQHLIQLGIRTSKYEQDHWESKFGIKQYWADHIRAHGVQSIIKELNEHLANTKASCAYLSFDIDALDSMEASATGTPEAGGLSKLEAMALIEGIDIPILGADIMEIAPLNNPHQAINEPQLTINAGADISEVLLGKLKISRP